MMLDVNPSLLPSTLAFEHQLSNGVWLCQLLAEVLPEKEITDAIFDSDHDTYKVNLAIRETYYMPA